MLKTYNFRIKGEMCNCSNAKYMKIIRIKGEMCNCSNAKYMKIMQTFISVTVLPPY
jgi:hypothetical protein